MKPIKFRGKAIMPIEELNEMGFEHDNGWVFGNLIQNGNEPWIVGDLVEVDDEYIVHDFWVRVHLDSVGQYTGLKDKNGKEICGADIGWDEHRECYGVVKFDEGKFLYEWENISDDLFEVCDDVEIIGNTFEHSHLLEQQK